jgi:hypothetical protein
LAVSSFAEELIEQMSSPFYRCVATMIFVPGGGEVATDLVGMRPFFSPATTLVSSPDRRFTGATRRLKAPQVPSHGLYGACQCNCTFGWFYYHRLSLAQNATKRVVR